MAGLADARRVRPARRGAAGTGSGARLGIGGQRREPAAPSSRSESSSSSVRGSAGSRIAATLVVTALPRRRPNSDRRRCTRSLPTWKSGSRTLAHPALVQRVRLAQLADVVTTAAVDERLGLLAAQQRARADVADVVLVTGPDAQRLVSCVSGLRSATAIRRRSTSVADRALCCTGVNGCRSCAGATRATPFGVLDPHRLLARLRHDLAGEVLRAPRRSAGTPSCTRPGRL